MQSALFFQMVNDLAYMYSATISLEIFPQLQGGGDLGEYGCGPNHF